MLRSDSSIVASQPGDWVDGTGLLSQTFTKLISNTTCVRLCSLYVDEQVEYEIRQEDCVSGMDRMVSVVSSVGGAASNMLAFHNGNDGMDVQLYKQFLFDEDSVLTSLTEREEEDESLHADHDELIQMPRSLSKSHGLPRTAQAIQRRRQHDAKTSEDDEDHLTILTQRSN